MLRNIRKAPITIANLKVRVKFPQKFKGTFVEKLADYWKNLFIDYRQMVLDLRTDIQDNPRKAMMWTTGLVTLYLLHKNNPDELEFKDSLKKMVNEIVMVNDSCRNPRATDHLNYLNNCYNQRVIHYRNLGILSVMYTTDLSGTCDLYKAQCQYLQPSYLSFPLRIVDVGVMGRWWNIFIKTTNYDVNFSDSRT